MIRDNVLEVLSGVQGENSVKILGPDLDELEMIGNQVVASLLGVPGVKDVGLYRIRGQCNIELPIDRQKCSLWNISVADVHNVIQTAIGGKTVSQMIEGEKSFDLTIRWPLRLREDESDILDIPVDVTGHQVTVGSQASAQASGSSVGIASKGSSSTMPSPVGSVRGTSPLESATTPRERLRDLITPLGETDDDRLNAEGQFVRPGASTIAREEGSRLIAVKFGVRGRDLASAVAEAKRKVNPLIPKGYRAEWSGEFQQMEEGERRLMIIVPLSLVLVFVLLYLAFHSMLDAAGRVGQCAGSVAGRHLGVVSHRHQLQHRRGRRFHLDIRRGDHGRAVAGVELQPASSRGHAAAPSNHARGRATQCGR